MPKHLDLDADQRKELGERIVELWRDDNTDRQDWLDKLPLWLDACQGRPKAKDTPWPGASNFHVPLTRTHKEAIHPRLMAALFQPEPLVSVRGQEPSDEDRAKKTERFLDYVTRDEVPLFQITDRALDGAETNGVQFVKWTWDLKTRHLRTTHDFPPDLMPNDVIAAVVKGEQQFKEALQRVEGDAAKEVLADLEQDREIVIEVTVTPTSLRVVTEREEVVKDAPRGTLVDAEDIVVNSDAYFDLDEADHLIHRYWLTLDEVKRRVKRGTFKLTDDELTELEALQSSESVEGDDNTVAIKQTVEDVTGVSTQSRQGEPMRLEVLDAYLGYDVNDDDLDEQIVATTFRRKPELIARAVRREDLFRHDMLPFSTYHMYPVAGSFWSTGIPQMLEGIQIELNTIHNQRVDAGTVGNTPYGWYVPAAGFNPEPMAIKPGYLLPVDDINRVKMAQPGNYTAWGIQEEAGLLAMAEKLTKVNDLTLGRIGETQGAARTASGVQALASQQASGFDILIRRVQEGHKRSLQLILALYAQYMPPGREVRVMGKYQNEPETIVTRDDLKGSLDLRFTGNSLNTDREIERQAYTYLAGGPMNPQVLTQALAPMGITSPPGIAEWYRHLLKAFDVPGLDRIIMVPEQKRMLAPEEVINRTIAGERLDVNPGEDHQRIIQSLMTLLNGPDAIGLSPESIMAMQDQVARRQQQMQVDQQVQMIQQAMQMQQMMAQGPSAPGGPSGMGGPPGAPPMGGPPPGAPGPPQPAAPPRPAVFGA